MVTKTTFYILDNSESMRQEDGHIWNWKTEESLTCSRWEEMKHNADLIMKFNRKVNSMFLLLNPRGDDENEWREGRDFLFINPHERCVTLEQLYNEDCIRGSTPITKALKFVQHFANTHLYKFDDDLEWSVVFLTDAIPDKSASMSQEVAFACNHLGIFITAGLLGDDDKVHTYYQHLDDLYDRFDTISWYEQRRETIANINPWLKYHYWIHICCMAGHFGDYATTSFDKLNEEECTYSEIIEILGRLYPNFRLPPALGKKDTFSREHFIANLSDVISQHDANFRLTRRNRMINVDELIEVAFPLDICEFGDMQSKEFDHRYHDPAFVTELDIEKLQEKDKIVSIKYKKHKDKKKKATPKKHHTPEKKVTKKAKEVKEKKQAASRKNEKSKAKKDGTKLVKALRAKSDTTESMRSRKNVTKSMRRKKSDEEKSLSIMEVSESMRADTKSVRGKSMRNDTTSMRSMRGKKITKSMRDKKKKFMP